MKTAGTILALTFFVSTSFAAGGNVSGRVTIGGAPLKGAFVNIRNAQTKMTIHVLSDQEGRYQAENVPAGEYRVQPAKIGYNSAPKTGVRISENQSTSLDFTMQKRPVRWTELSDHQGRALLPQDEGRAQLNRCI